MAFIFRASKDDTLPGDLSRIIFGGSDFILIFIIFEIETFLVDSETVSSKVNMDGLKSFEGIWRALGTVWFAQKD